MFTHHHKLIRTVSGMMVVIAASCYLTSCSNTGASEYPPIEPTSLELRSHVHALTVDIGPRSLSYVDGLNAASTYIQNQFIASGYTPTTQKYQADGEKVENIIASLGPKEAPRIIVGAHYDSYDDQVGADDNASGVAGLLILAKQLKPYAKQLNYRIDFVAYTLEEPPYFRTELMGSYQHAYQLKSNDIPVAGMISLEMIGYFNDQKNSQSYPVSLMKLIYPSEGNFIGVVSNFSSRSLKNKVARHMKKAPIAVETLTAPSSLTGVDFSDHLNYWAMGYKAVMITDTSFYRNHHYHTHNDTIEALDFDKMHQVVQSMFYALLNMASE